MATAWILSASDASSGYSTAKWLSSSAASATASANPAAPRPPSAKCVVTVARTPYSAAISAMAARSAAWSSGKALMATTGVQPCNWMFWICLRRLSPPRCTSSGFSASSASGSGRPATMRWRPECAFSPRTVATSTAASGASPE